ncbi:MAG: Galactarate dehydratase (L-threo-forming) [Verrucomicrobia subdivision 3 bacterium]|nr:Galactarate dehydratase (L-threo-forming) [Limisphaerales bacterium]MCS1417726.1 Galactarate dehydratase (L-threo-forming) [Limisphaerales bacterium]
MKAVEDITIQLRPDDNVAVLKSTLKAGAELAFQGQRVVCRQTIPAGHKIALSSLDQGEALIKYGQKIGFAKTTIQRGDHVHTQNVAMEDFGRDYQFCVDYEPVKFVPESDQQTFQGFERADGKAGTRNYITVISSVNCSASVSKYVAERFRTPEFQREYSNVDGVIAVTHKSGCSLLPSEPLAMLQRVLAGMARHPNVGGYVMIGLGCEVNQISHLIRDQGLDQASPGGVPPVYLNIQAEGGVRKTTEAGVEAVQKILGRVNGHQRTSQPVSKLILAMNCGGSDGNSGITANPALGYASDQLIRQGATSVLAETTEIYGAEHLLTRRAVSEAVGQKLIDLIHWWEDHVKLHNASIDNNPSYGNKEGGLTTICEKSLGAIAKAGQSPLSEVYRYAEPIVAKGLCFMDTPGNDPVSMTGLVSGGCNIGTFTTGRGSVYGCKPSPCIKIATNTPLYNWMEEDMDINAGTILEREETVEQVGQRIFDKILAVASGKRTKSELAGMGDEEFSPWQIGPVL